MYISCFFVLISFALGTQGVFSGIWTLDFCTGIMRCMMFFSCFLVLGSQRNVISGRIFLGHKQLKNISYALCGVIQSAFIN